MGGLLERAPRGALVAGAIGVAALCNLVIGIGAAAGEKALFLAAVVGLLPVLAIGFGALIENHRATIAWTALALNFIGIAQVTDPLPLPGATRVFVPDILLMLAIGSWLASRLSRTERVGAVRTSPAFTWPLALFAVTMMLGVVVGNERYGASVVGQPLRIVLYAGIVLALTDTDAVSAWRAITRVFYAGAVVQAFLAVYYLVTGTSQTDSDVLSTGGIRILALSVAMYLTGSLVCALLNLERERLPMRQVGHAIVAGLALFGIVVSFGRTTYAAVVLVVPLLLLTRRYMRRALLVLIPLFAPALVLMALLVPVAAPTLVPTLQARLSGTSTNDDTVVWRDRARQVAMEGVNKEWLTGVGFGRVTHFEFKGTTVTIEGDPHNSYVYLLQGGGLLALGSFLLLGAVYAGDALRRLRRAEPVGQAIIVWSLATWLTFMINALAGPIFPDPVLMMSIWILMGLPGLVAREGVGAGPDEPDDPRLEAH